VAVVTLPLKALPTPGSRRDAPAPKPTRLKAPLYARLSGAELHALYNLAGHELAGSTYLLLIGQSVLNGKYAGHVLTSYPTLQSLLRPPRPERGQWPAAPSLKRVRTCMEALERAGLIDRDKGWNKVGKQLRCRLTLRIDSRSS
jgi:hypothetical protein